MSHDHLDGYRRQWPRVGAVLGMGVGGATALASRRMTVPQVLSAANFIALLVHQYEEYQDPGYGGTQINRVMRRVFKGGSARNYPLNTQSAMCINTAIAYPVYVAPVVFPQKKWLGLGPVFFGMSQAGLHGILPRAALGEWYGPGFLSSALLHVPIGVAYIKALEREGPVTALDYRSGVGYAAAFFALGLVAPNLLMRKKDSPYAFTQAQMGPYSDNEPTK